jgi:flagellar basal-body rod protein FlgB
MLFGRIVEGLGRSLDLFVRRHGLIAQNLAHLETPGYRPQDLDFARALELAFAGAARREAPRHARHIPLASPMDDGEVVTDTRGSPGRDGNAVDLDRETARLMENGLRFDVATRILGHRLSLLKYVVTEGGK